MVRVKLRPTSLLIDIDVFLELMNLRTTEYALTHPTAKSRGKGLVDNGGYIP